MEPRSGFVQNLYSSVYFLSDVQYRRKLEEWGIADVTPPFAMCSSF